MYFTVTNVGSNLKRSELERVEQILTSQTQRGLIGILGPTVILDKTTWKLDKHDLIITIIGPYRLRASDSPNNNVTITLA